MKKSGRRASNFELLRLIAILFICFIHTFDKIPGYSTVIETTSSWQTWWSILVVSLGNIGNHLFFLLTGYFMVKQFFSWRKIAKLIGVVMFYTIFFGLFVAYFLNLNVPTNLTQLWQFLTPITHNNYWFVTTYILIILMSPALNDLVNKLTTKRRVAIFAVVVTIFYVSSTIGRYMPGAIDFSMQYELLTFAFTYLVGATLRLYLPKLPGRARYFLISGIVLEVAMVFLTVCIYRIWPFFYLFEAFHNNSLLVFILALTLFVFFAKLKINYLPKVNFLARASLDVYLIQATLFFQIIGKYMRFEYLATPLSVILYPFIVGIAMYLVGTLVYVVRKKLCSIMIK